MLTLNRLCADAVELQYTRRHGRWIQCNVLARGASTVVQPVAVLPPRASERLHSTPFRCLLGPKPGMPKQEASECHIGIQIWGLASPVTDYQAVQPSQLSLLGLLACLWLTWPF